MVKGMRLCVLMGMILLMLGSCAMAAPAEPPMALTETRQLPENTTALDSYAMESFEGKIVLSNLKSEYSGGRWLGFKVKYNDESVGSKISVEFNDGVVQVVVLKDVWTYEKKYVLRDNTGGNRLAYKGPVIIAVYDGNAVLTMGNKTVTIPGVVSLTGDMEIGGVGGKMEIYHVTK